MNHPTFVVLHCSDTPDNPSNAFYDTRPEDIDKWHKARGFKRIGYHYIVTRDGEVHAGRPPEVEGAHTRGRNTGSLGICLVGRQLFTPEQMDALYSLYFRLKEQYGIESKNWYCHNEFDPSKTCPNIHGSDLRERLEKL
jgi:N-acetylmuramoyl-L-alanine amidase